MYKLLVNIHELSYSSGAEAGGGGDWWLRDSQWDNRQAKDHCSSRVCDDTTGNFEGKHDLFETWQVNKSKVWMSWNVNFQHIWILQMRTMQHLFWWLGSLLKDMKATKKTNIYDNRKMETEFSKNRQKPHFFNFFNLLQVFCYVHVYLQSYLCVLILFW